MVDTRSNMQLADLNSKHHGRKSLRNIIDRAIGVCFYPPPGSLHYHQLSLGQFHDPTHKIVRKIRKVISKRQKHPIHAIVLRNPTQIRSKNTVQFYYLYLYGHEYWVDYKSPAYFHTNFFYMYRNNYRISVHHPHCKASSENPASC